MNDSLTPSYLDDGARITADQPRWVRHFFALTLRRLGEEVLRADGVTGHRFTPEWTEREEFEELTGVRSLIVWHGETSETISGQIEAPLYGIYRWNGPNNLQTCLHEFPTVEEAAAAMALVKEGRLPYPADGWIASMLDPQTPILIGENDVDGGDASER